MKRSKTEVRFYSRPRLKSPVLVAGWPGIANIGLTAVNYLRAKLRAKKLAEINPEPFFFPRKILIEGGLLRDMEFPEGTFYYYKGEPDLIFFLGEAQPHEEAKIYAMANLILDVAEKFGVRRVYTAAAAVASVHHSLEPRIWAVPNSPKLLPELKRYNVVLLSDLEERRGSGNITGLNGVLIGVARERNMEGVCFLGEIPVYIAHFPLQYPKASRAILNVLTAVLGVRIDMGEIGFYAEQADREIERLYQSLPPEVRNELDKLKTAAPQAGPITERDKEKILKEIEEFFKKGKGEQS